MRDLGKYDPIRRWSTEAKGLEVDELFQQGLAFLKEICNKPPPWTDVIVDELHLTKWLLQGDLLDGIRVPIFDDLQKLDNEGYAEVPLDAGTLIVMTQSCDLENRKAPMVSCCPVHTLDEFENVNPQFKKKGHWENVRRGKLTGLHLLPGGEPETNRDCLLVDFRVVHSLPIEYVIEFIKAENSHVRLASPYLEHLSQAFARVFMRVGLPTNIPKFT